MTSWRTPLVLLIAGSIIVSLSIGIRASFGLFLQPMSIDLGWGRETFALAIAIQNIVWGLSQPFFGAAADRWGGGKVIFASSLMYAAGIYLMANTSSGTELHFTLGVLVGLGLSGSSFAVVMAVVSRAYSPEKRPLALGIAGAGGSFGQFAFVPIGQSLINSYGWSTALLVLAAVATLTVLMAAPLSGRQSSQYDGREAQSFRAALAEARKHKGFLYLTAGFFVCGFHVTFIATHLPAYLSDRGLNANVAATSLALVGFFNIIGSLSTGWLGGRVSKKWILSTLYGLRSVVILVLLMVPMTEWTAYLFGASFGLLWLATVPVTSALVAQIFGPRYMGMLFGIVFFSHQAGSFLGVWLGGYVFDTTGSYDIVWWIGIALGLLAALLHMPINKQPVARLQPAQ